MKLRKVAWLYCFTQFRQDTRNSTLKYSAFIGATRSENSQNICNGIPIRTVQEQYEAQWKVETDKL